MLKPPPSRGRRRLLFARQKAFQWQACTCKHTTRRGFHCSDTETKRRPILSGHSVMVLLIKAFASFMHLFLGRSHGPLPCLHRVREAILDVVPLHTLSRPGVLPVPAVFARPYMDYFFFFAADHRKLTQQVCKLLTSAKLAGCVSTEWYYQ